MKILMTQRELVSFGGSELVTIELARALHGRGHEVAIYCPRPGPLTRLAGAVVTASSLRDLPWAPDVIHGHHHLPTVAAMARFENAPAVYCWHGFRPWVERPPAHERIARYIVMCEWMAPRLEADLRAPKGSIVTIPNFVNTTRFSRIRDPAKLLRRALLYGHGGFREEELTRLGAACEAHGLSFHKIGYPYGNPNPAPEVFLPEYDLVFAIGRCALEALACGCAVVPVVPGLAGRLVTGETLGHWAYSNFSPVHFTAADRVDEDWLASQLAAYSADGQAGVTALIRTGRDLERAVDAFEQVYRDAADAPRAFDRGSDFAP